MSMVQELPNIRSNTLPFYDKRVDLACAFRWTARLNMNEAVSNHFSLAVDAEGTKFLINPNQVHFSRIKASDLILVDANDPNTLDRPGAPDRTAWGLHGAVHRNCAHARCVMHVHPTYATVLASLADSSLPPIDQSSALFYNRHVVDGLYGGLAFEDEGERCSRLLSDPKIRVVIMGNHGILVIGDSVEDTFNRLYYFERAAQTYIKALWTGRPLRILEDAIAEQTALDQENYAGQAAQHFSELRAILDDEGSPFRS